MPRRLREHGGDHLAEATRALRRSALEILNDTEEWRVSEEDREAIERVEKQLRLAAVRLGEDDPIGRGLGELADAMVERLSREARPS